MNRARRLLPLLFLSTAIGCSTPEPSSTAPPAPGITVQTAWSRPTAAVGAAPEGLPVAPGVVYLQLVNGDDVPRRLMAARSEVCDVVEIHETRLRDDRMSMAPVTDGLEIPAGGSLKMKPGGHHLMLMELRRHLRPGERFPLVLEIDDGTRVEAEVEVHEP